MALKWIYEVKASSPISTKTMNKPARRLTFFLSYFAPSSELFVLDPETNILPFPVNKITVAMIASVTIAHIIQINHIIKTPFNS